MLQHLQRACCVIDCKKSGNEIYNFGCCIGCDDVKFREPSLNAKIELLKAKTSLNCVAYLYKICMRLVLCLPLIWVLVRCTFKQLKNHEKRLANVLVSSIDRNVEKIIRTRPPTREATKQCYVDPRPYLLYATCLSKDFNALNRIQTNKTQIEQIIIQPSPYRTASVGMSITLSCYTS
jgi:hypothetical protein